MLVVMGVVALLLHEHCGRPTTRIEPRAAFDGPIDQAGGRALVIAVFGDVGRPAMYAAFHDSVSVSTYLGATARPVGAVARVELDPARGTFTIERTPVCVCVDSGVVVAP